MTSFVDQMVDPLNTLVLVQSKLLPATADEPANQTEPIYGTTFSQRKFSAFEIDIWSNAPINSSMTLPPENPYIPSDLSMLPMPPVSAHNSPSLIQNTSNGANIVWWQQDRLHRVPVVVIHSKAYIGAMSGLTPHNVGSMALSLQEAIGTKEEQILTGRAWMDTDKIRQLEAEVASLKMQLHSTAEGSPLVNIYSQIIGAMVLDALTDHTYLATLAGCSWSYNLTPDFIRLTVRAYSDPRPLEVLLNRVLDVVTNPSTWRQEHLELVIQEIGRSLNNFDTQQPYRLQYIQLKKS